MLPGSNPAPPIITRSASRAIISGAMAKATATLVSGPVATKVTEFAGARRTVSIIKLTACCSDSCIVGSASGWPLPLSRPLSPCTCSAVTISRMTGRGQPAYTGVSPVAARVTTFRALSTVASSCTLPPTTVRPRRSISSGEANASKMATASSWPGSQSRIILFVTLSSQFAKIAALPAMTNTMIRHAKFSIGQVVKHRVYPFRGVIFDVDPEFGNTQEWYDAIPENMRPHKDQPYYHLYAENEETEYVAYVSEQNLLPDDSKKPIRHPLVEELFERHNDSYIIRDNSHH